MVIMRQETGRPTAGEYNAEVADDIEAVEGNDAVEALRHGAAMVEHLFGGLDEEAIRGRTYAPGKWTLKQILGHLADDERIFGYRILSIARGDTRPLPGFDENAYMEASNF